MSLASVQPPSSCYQHDNIDDYYCAEHTVLSIEELRLQLYSCFTCGVSWLEDHVCLDCSECGGYSLQRPCPLCDGCCGSSWKRDLSMSHACGKARWSGKCQQEGAAAVSTDPRPPTRGEQLVCNLLNKLAPRS
uniref:Protein pinocchio n=1 Tax=Graphocephala atropunctata TaxID=36148 RepID=A0A1B6LTC9_9HEMI